MVACLASLTKNVEKAVNGAGYYWPKHTEGSLASRPALYLGRTRATDISKPTFKPSRWFVITMKMPFNSPVICCNSQSSAWVLHDPLLLVVVVEAWRLEITRRSLLNRAWLLYLKGISALPTARNSNEVARVWYLRCYLHTSNGEFTGLVHGAFLGTFRFVGLYKKVLYTTV